MSECVVVVLLWSVPFFDRDQGNSPIARLKVLMSTILLISWRFLPYQMPDIVMSSSMQDTSIRNPGRRVTSPSFSFLHCVILLWTVQWCVTATTVPPLTAKAGREYKQQYGDASLEGSKWKTLRLVRVLK